MTVKHALVMWGIGMLLAGPVQAGSDVLDGGLRRLSRNTPVPAVTSVAAAGEISVLVRGSQTVDALAAAGFRVITTSGGVMTARGPGARIGELSRVPGLQRAMLASSVEMLLDAAVLDIGVNQLRVREGDTHTGKTGSGVIIGIVDSGVDPDHADFRRADGTTRILRYWDQVSEAGSPPEIQPGVPLYGTEWFAADINSGTISSVDAVGHGTHVAGIAAGDGSDGTDPARQYLFAGVAPGAELVVVQAQFLDASIIDAVNYVFSVATKLGRPAVVNLSLGSQIGPHDGTSMVDRAISGLLKPGKLISVAAGNEGDKQIHAELHVAPGGQDSAGVVVDYQGQGPDPSVNFFAVNAFYHRPDSMSITVVTPSGTRYGPYFLGDEQPEVATGEGTLYLLHWDGDPTTSNLELQMDVSSFDPAPKPNAPSGDPPAAGIWRLVFTDHAGSPAGGEVDLWIPASSPFRARWQADREDPGETLASPSTALGAIAVGAYNTKRCWLKVPPPGTHCTTIPSPEGDPQQLTFFSSRGPTRDGRAKPDVVAPGFVIVSSLSADISPEFQARLNLTATEDPDRAHYANVGSSMAAGFVTGALALLLEQSPNTTPADAERRLRVSARTDGVTGTVWNDRFGYGKLNVPQMLDTTLVAVNLHRLSLNRVGDAYAISWSAEAGEVVAGFRVHLGIEDKFRELESLEGPGPHTVRVTADPRGTVVRIEARRRDGAMDLWAETDPLFPWKHVPLLGPAHPNPFQGGETLVRLSPGAGDVGFPMEAEVLDLSGRRVRLLESERVSGAGAMMVSWDGLTDRATPAPAGVYWVRVRTQTSQGVTRVVKLP